MKLKEIVKKVILQRLQYNNGNLTKTANDLGISLRGLRYKLRKYEKEDIGDL